MPGGARSTATRGPITPLLDNPLEGPVYLRSSTHKLPDLVLALNGQIDVVLVGTVDTGSKSGGHHEPPSKRSPTPRSPKSSWKCRAARRACWSTRQTSAASRSAPSPTSIGQNGTALESRPLIAQRLQGRRPRSSRATSVTRAARGAETAPGRLARLLALARGRAWRRLPGPARQPAGPPQIDATWVTEVTATSATLHAEVNPNGAPTTYRFEYLTQAAYEANLNASQRRLLQRGGQVPPRARRVGSGSFGAEVSQHVGSTQPRHRLPLPRRRDQRRRPRRHRPRAQRSAPRSATNVFSLPDGRGWEMVSPPTKTAARSRRSGSDLRRRRLPGRGGGGAVTYSSASSFAGGAGAPPGQPVPLPPQRHRLVAPRTSPRRCSRAATASDPDGVPYQLFSDRPARAALHARAGRPLRHAGRSRARAATRCAKARRRSRPCSKRQRPCASKARQPRPAPRSSSRSPRRPASECGAEACSRDQAERCQHRRARLAAPLGGDLHRRLRVYFTSRRRPALPARSGRRPRRSPKRWAAAAPSRPPPPTAASPSSPRAATSTARTPRAKPATDLTPAAACRACSAPPQTAPASTTRTPPASSLWTRHHHRSRRGAAPPRPATTRPRPAPPGSAPTAPTCSSSPTRRLTGYDSTTATEPRSSSTARRRAKAPRPSPASPATRPANARAAASTSPARSANGEQGATRLYKPRALSAERQPPLLRLRRRPRHPGHQQRPRRL